MAKHLRTSGACIAVLRALGETAGPLECAAIAARAHVARDTAAEVVRSLMHSQWARKCPAAGAGRPPRYQAMTEGGSRLSAFLTELALSEAETRIADLAATATAVPAGCLHLYTTIATNYLLGVPIPKLLVAPRIDTVRGALRTFRIPPSTFDATHQST